MQAKFVRLPVPFNLCLNKPWELLPFRKFDLVLRRMIFFCVCVFCGWGWSFTLSMLCRWGWYCAVSVLLMRIIIYCVCVLCRWEAGRGSLHPWVRPLQAHLAALRGDRGVAVARLLHQAGRATRPQGPGAQEAHVLVHQRLLRQQNQGLRHLTQTNTGELQSKWNMCSTWNDPKIIYYTQWRFPFHLSRSVNSLEVLFEQTQWNFWLISDAKPA